MQFLNPQKILTQINIFLITILIHLNKSYFVFVRYTNDINVTSLTKVVYMVAAIPIHVILSHTGIPIALKITDSSSIQYN